MKATNSKMEKVDKIIIGRNRSEPGTSESFRYACLEKDIEENILLATFLTDDYYGGIDYILRVHDNDTERLLNEREICFKSTLETLNALSLHFAIKGSNDQDPLESIADSLAKLSCSGKWDF